VEDKQRHQRLRLLLKKLNKDRKKQNQKIDILCNDFISAQRNFIKKLGIINFTASFYESILGLTDLKELLCTAVSFIKAENEDINITFFLRRDGDPILQEDDKMGNHESYELHIFDSDQPAAIEKGAPFCEQSAKWESKQYIESCFTRELMDNISGSNKVCTLDDMYAMGLNGNLNELNKISPVTIPLGLLSDPILQNGNPKNSNTGILGSSLGFILVYRSSQDKLNADQISRISAVTSGLSRAIISCRVLSKTPD
jgi:hypothetical protein